MRFLEAMSSLLSKVRPSTNQEVYGFDSWLVMGPGHTKDFENSSGLCLHGTEDEVGTTKHNWLAMCQYNVTGWVSMWVYGMLT